MAAGLRYGVALLLHLHGEEVHGDLVALSLDLGHAHLNHGVLVRNVAVEAGGDHKDVLERAKG